MSTQTDAAIERFIDPLRSIYDGVRWVSRTNLHLTLRFLGNEAPLAQLATMATKLAIVAKETQPFSIIAEGIGGFPNLARPRVIWIGLKSDELIELAAEVRAAALRAGFGDEDYPYAPHLTIARVRDPKRLTSLRAILKDAHQRNFGLSKIASMALFRSVVGAAGPKYIELKRWNLGDS